MKKTLRADIVVAGGGPAGINAAIAAGREGASVILLERYGFLGGMSTIASVYPWMTFHTMDGKQVIKGIGQEIVERLMEQGASPGHLRDTVGFTHTLTPYDPEHYKLLAFDMLEEAGVKVLVHSFVSGVEMTGDAIRSLQITTKSGIVAIEGGVFIDTSGDADVAYLAGAPVKLGRDADNRTQPMTMKFRMRGVDVDKIKAYMLEHPDDFYHKTPFDELEHMPLTGVSGFYSQWKKANIPINRDQVLFFIGPAPDEVLVNCTRVQGLDGTNVEDLAIAEREGRRQVMMMAEFLKRDVPGFEQAVISSVGTQIGVRETRRIDGLYSLTQEDVVEGRRFEDVIARSGYPIDIHDPTGKGVVSAWISGDGAYDIPYRCLVPRKVRNLLVAGRCISTTHEALATTRLTPSCMATGQAAGTAAAIACRDKVDAAKIDIGELQQRLREQNVVLS